MLKQIKKWRSKESLTPSIAAAVGPAAAAAAAAADDDDDDKSKGLLKITTHVTITPSVLVKSDIDDTTDSFTGITMGLSPAEYNNVANVAPLPAVLPPKPKLSPIDGPRSSAGSGSSASLTVPGGGDPMGMGLSQRSISRTPSRSSLNTVAAALGEEAEAAGFNDAPAQEVTLIMGELEWEFKVNKWKKRRFLLTKDALTYVRESPSMFQNKYVPVVRIADLSMVDQDMTCMLIHESCFVIKPRNGKPLYFKSGDMRVSEAWLEVLRQLVADANTAPNGGAGR